MMFSNSSHTTCDNFNKTERYVINKENTLKKRRKEILLLHKVHMSSCVLSMINEIEIKIYNLFASDNTDKLTSCSSFRFEPEEKERPGLKEKYIVKMYGEEKVIDKIENKDEDMVNSHMMYATASK